MAGAVSYLGDVIPRFANVCSPGGLGIVVHHAAETVLDRADQAESTSSGAGHRSCRGLSLYHAVATDTIVAASIRTIPAGGAAAAVDPDAALQRILEPARLLLRRLEQLQLVLLRLKSLLYELKLHVLLVTESKVGPDQSGELAVDMQRLGCRSLPRLQLHNQR